MLPEDADALHILHLGRRISHEQVDAADPFAEPGGIGQALDRRSKPTPDSCNQVQRQIARVEPKLVDEPIAHSPLVRRPIGSHLD